MCISEEISITTLVLGSLINFYIIYYLSDKLDNNDSLTCFMFVLTWQYALLMQIPDAIAWNNIKNGKSTETAGKLAAFLNLTQPIILLIGILFTLVIHLVRSHLTAKLFFKYLSKPNFNMARIDDHYHLKVKGIANFVSIIKLRKLLAEIPENDQIVFDFSRTRLIDFSMYNCFYLVWHSFQNIYTGSEIQTSFTV